MSNKAFTDAAEAAYETAEILFVVSAFIDGRMVFSEKTAEAPTAVEFVTDADRVVKLSIMDQVASRDA